MILLVNGEPLGHWGVNFERCQDLACSFQNAKLIWNAFCLLLWQIQKGFYKQQSEGVKILSD